MNFTITRATTLRGKPPIPGDKSISHRSLIFGALADGTTEVSHILESADIRSTWKCLQAMGVVIQSRHQKVMIQGRGLRGFRRPSQPLDCGNSGTTLRLLMGLLAGQNFSSVLTGDDSLRHRPMKRIADPLCRMGAEISLLQTDFAPVTMCGPTEPETLRAISYELTVASAQLKSAIILAALQAAGTTTLYGKIHSRDHTERMLPHFGVKIEERNELISIPGHQMLESAKINVPGDLSTAAFWVGAAALVPGSEIELEGVSLNPTRTGFLSALQRMGVKMETEVTSLDPERMGNIRVFSGPLHGTVIDPQEVPSLIDELPILAVLACSAVGVTEVRGAEELRIKECDRIEAVALNIRAMGGTIETFKDGFRIVGPQKLTGATIDSFHDHRIAMAFSIAGLVAAGSTNILNAECVEISYPAFYETLASLRNG